MAITTLLATLLGLAAGADAGPVTLSGEQGAKLLSSRPRGRGRVGDLQTLRRRRRVTNGCLMAEQPHPRLFSPRRRQSNRHGT